MPAHSGTRPTPVRALLVLSQVYAGGGIQRFNRMFLAALHLLGVHCDVLSLGDSEDSRAHWSAPDSMRIRFFDRNKIRFALGVGAAITCGSHDLIVVGHLNFLSLVAGCRALRAARHTQVLMIAHGIEVWHGMDNRLTQWAIAKVHRILCVSRYTRERIQDQCPELEDTRYALFPNALSASWLQERSTAAALRPSNRLPKRFILSVTRLDRGDRYKGITTLIESLSMLHDPALQCVIAGDGDDRPYLEGMAQRCGVSDRITFLGSVSDAELGRLYSQCLAFVLPSGKEGFGIVFLEAMHFGAPVIAAREKGAVDVVEHEATGLLVTYGDTMGLAGAIRRLLNEPELRARLINNGRNLVGSQGPFSFQAFVGRLGSLLNLPVPRPAPEADTQRVVTSNTTVAEARVRSS